MIKEDVAENYDRYLEVMYATGDHYEGFQEFYLESVLLELKK